MLQRGSRQRGASQISVQNYSGCIDDCAQRVTRRLPDLPFDRARDSREGKVDAAGIQSRGGNLRSQPAQHGASGIGDNCLPFALNG